MMKHAKLFNSVNNITKMHAQELLKTYGETIQVGCNVNAKILDIGCGDGSVTELLTRHLPHARWSACDISTDMIKFAKETYGGLGVDFFLMDIRKKVEKELRAKFNRVFCLLVLHRIQNQRIAFSNMHSLVEPNGLCLVNMILDSELYKMDRRMAKNPKWSPYIRDVENVISPYNRVENPEESLKEVMMECGFRDVVTNTDYFFRPCDEKYYRNLVKSIDPVLSEIPLELHDEYINDYFKLLAVNGDSSPYDYRCSVLEAIGYK